MSEIAFNLEQSDRLDRFERPQTGIRWRKSVNRVVAHMHDHLGMKHSSEGFANIAAVSRFHFNRLFRHLTGLPPAHFLAALRIEMAKQLLLSTDLSVTDICFEVGYESLGSFISRFTELVGMPPGRLRRIARELEGSDLSEFCQSGASLSGSTTDGAAIEGHIETDSEFEGIVFVGLYKNLMPHARPIQCMALTPASEFHFKSLAAGNYVIAAATLSRTIARNINLQAFLNESIAFRAAYGPVVISAGRPHHVAKLVLRPNTHLDPPILAPLPVMLISACVYRKLDLA